MKIYVTSDSTMTDERFNAVTLRLRQLGYEAVSSLHSQVSPLIFIVHCDAVLVLNAYSKCSHDLLETEAFDAMCFATVVKKMPVYFENDIEMSSYHSNYSVIHQDLFQILANEEVNGISPDNHLLAYFNHQDLENIRGCDDLYLKAALIVRRLFQDKTDKSDKPYVGHLQRVSDRLDDEISKVAGLLHDTVEDTDVTCRDLMEVGFPLEIVEVVYLVTKPDLGIMKKKYSEEERLSFYNQEIDSIIASGNYYATQLKEADMSDNYNPERLSLLPEERQAWFHKKYGKQLVKLKKINNQRRDNLC